MITMAVDGMPPLTMSENQFLSSLSGLLSLVLFAALGIAYFLAGSQGAATALGLLLCFGVYRCFFAKRAEVVYLAAGEVPPWHQGAARDHAGPADRED